MRTSIQIASLILGGLVVVGCNKDNSTTTTTPDGTKVTVTPPTPPVDTSKVDNAVDKTAGAVKNGLDKMAGAVPTTMPTMPK